LKFFLGAPNEIARRQYPKSKAQYEDLFRQIAFSGYWYSRSPKGYSVSVVPVMWPKLPAWLSTAGAGDAVSAMLAVLGRK